MTNLKSLTVYLGSGGKAPTHFKDTAAHLGKYLAQNNIKTVYGGMDAGLMGVLANNALDAGGAVLGIIPTSIRDRNFVHQTLLEKEEMIIVDGMWERKKLLIDHGDAVMALPGGYGTLDEIFEFLYWGLKGFHNKVTGLLNVDHYWDPLLDFLNLAVEKGDLEPIIFDMLYINNDVEALIKDLSEACLNHENTKISGTETHISEIEEDNLRKTQDPIIIEGTDIESLYRLANALVLKQLSKVVRPIGVLDTERLFAPFKLWIYNAATNFFITPYCPDMALFADDKERLKGVTRNHIHVSVELREKWEGIEENASLAKR